MATKMYKNMGVVTDHWSLGHPPILLLTSSLPIPLCCDRFSCIQSSAILHGVGLCPCTLVLKTLLRHVDQEVIPSFYVNFDITVTKKYKNMGWPHTPL